ncbi:hypothetical protein D3C85_89950 [compost metagenome]
MSADYVTHKYENGNVSLHDVGGVLFIMEKTTNEDKTTVAHYKNLFEIYPTEQDHEEIRQELITGITTSKWSKRTLHALVRSGDPKHWRYFPVPLLFEDDPQIRKQSTDRGFPAKSAGWYRRKRNLILKIVGFPAIP